MNKGELTAYLASIASLMDSIDDAGVVKRPQWLIDEYNRGWDKLKDAVAKEDEERKRNEARAKRPSGDGEQPKQDRREDERFR
jgi:hypothetical protein